MRGSLPLPMASSCPAWGVRGMHGRLGCRRRPRDHRCPSHQRAADACDLRRSPGAVRGRGRARRADRRTASGPGWWNNSTPHGCRTWAGTPSRHRQQPAVRGYRIRPLLFRAQLGGGRALLRGGGASWAEHGGDRFVAAMEDGRSVTQFHPEKSGDAGSPDQQLVATPGLNAASAIS